MMTHIEEGDNLKNKKVEDIFYYIFMAGLIVVSFIQIYNILFIIHPDKGDFGVLLISIWSAVLIYLINIKQVIVKSEKKVLWRIVIGSASLIVAIIVLALLFWIP